MKEHSDQKPTETTNYEVTHVIRYNITVNSFKIVREKTYIHNGDSYVFYFVRLNVGVLAVQCKPGGQFTLVQAFQLKHKDHTLLAH